MTESFDPIAFELFKNALFSMTDDMALTIFRTTYSGVLKDNMDYSTGFADADGKLVAQGLTLPGHLGSVPTAMESIMRHYGDDMVEGDVFIMNDPFDGGMHLPDIFVFKPLYHEGKRLAFACTVCHHTDVGGDGALRCLREGLAPERDLVVDRDRRGAVEPDHLELALRQVLRGGTRRHRGQQRQPRHPTLQHVSSPPFYREIL